MDLDVCEFALADEFDVQHDRRSTKMAIHSKVLNPRAIFILRPADLTNALKLRIFFYLQSTNTCFSLQFQFLNSSITL